MARRSGVAVSTLHFYEAKGLIASRPTGAGNQRRHARDVLRRVAFIRATQCVGTSWRTSPGARHLAREQHAEPSWDLD